MYASTRSRLVLPLGTLASSALVGLWTFKTYHHYQWQGEEEDLPFTHHQPSFSRPLLAFLGASTSPACCESGRPRGGAKIEREHVIPDHFNAIKLPVGIDSRAEQLLGRLLPFARDDLSKVAKFRREKNGIQVYTVREGSIPDPLGTTGLPFARIGEVVINVPAEDVADTWWFFNCRKEWDSLNTTASQVVEDYGPTKRMVYLKGAPKPMISPRDFVYVIFRLAPQDVGGRIGSYAFLQVNAADAVPDNNNAVRGNVNSLLTIDPINPISTRVRYVIEAEPKGWVPAWATEAAADDLVSALGLLKEFLEKRYAGTDERQLVEEMERVKETDQQKASLVESVTASREDLEALRKMLKGKLDQVKKDEKQLGVPLTELKDKIHQDLRTVEARLRASHQKK